MRKWPTKTLADVSLSIDYGHTASASATKVGPKMLRITDIQQGAVSWDSVPFCLCSAQDEAAALLKSGDIVFARTGATTGKSYLIKTCPSRAVFASYLIRVRPSDAIDPRFLAHFFDTPDYWRQITSASRGAAQPGVNASVLKTLRIPVPPIAEQQRIAAILDQADALRTMRRQVAGHNKRLVTALFHAAFPAPAIERSMQLLENLASISSGVTVHGISRDQMPLRVPYLRVANVQAGHLSLSEVKDIGATQREIDLLRLEIGDVLMTEGGDFDKLGRGAMWSGQIDPCIHQNHIFRVRLDRGKLLPDVFAIFLETRWAKRYFLTCAKKTSNLASINMTQLRALPTLCPTMWIQKRFVEKLTEVRRLQNLSRTAEKVSDALFASLQHRAFRGEL